MLKIPKKYLEKIKDIYIELESKLPFKQGLFPKDNFASIIQVSEQAIKVEIAARNKADKEKIQYELAKTAAMCIRVIKRLDDPKFTE